MALTLKERALAGQLSGFIGKSEEVKNALVNGLHSNVNQLEKLLQASCGDKGCCDIKNFSDDHLKSLQKTFDNIDKIATEINGLKKDVAEKGKASGRTPSDGQSEIQKLNEKINDLKEKIFQQSSELKNQINIVIELVEKKIKELEPKKNKVDSLQRKVNELKKEIDAKPNNVDQLKNLKNQLEAAQNDFPEKESKSLDSHSASKKSLKTLKELCGYAEKIHENSKTQNNDGNCAEILKNLCTGLEKFLGYHDGNYTGEGIVYSDLDRLCDGVMSFLHGVLCNIQGHLGLHSDKIREAIESLNTNKHLGKEGFNAAIVKVVSGVREYNEGVVKSNTSIKSPIWTFLQPFKKDKGELMKQINALQVSDVPRQAEQEASKAKSLVESCLRHSNVFDSALSKLTKDINDLNAQCKTSVNSSHKNVKYEIKRLEQLSSREHGDLAAMIKLIGTKLNGLGVEVKDEICKQVRDLVEHLKGRVQLIKLQLEDVNKSLKEYLKDIDQWMSEADRIVDENTSQTGFIIDKKPGWEYRQKLEKLPDEMKKFGENPLEIYISGVRDQLQSKVQEARQNLEKLDKVYKNKLWSIAEAVKQVEPAIEKLGGVIENGDADVGKGKNIKSIVNHVKGKVEGIQGIKGLQGIKNGVVTYAMGVARNMEDATIVTWVSEIAKNNETVNRDIGYYFKKSGDLQKAIKAITNKIKGIVSKVGKKPSDQGDVKSILASIHKYHQAVAEAVREKLAWKEVCNIAKEVEDEPELKSTSKSPTFKMGFEYAVQTILRHVYTSASNLATEFESFVSTKNTNLDTNIDTALSEAEPLFKHLNQAVAGTNHAQAVDTAIAQVQTQVQHISGPADNVNLGDSSINSERDAAYNPLEQAIQGISSEASLLTVKATSDALGDWGEKITKHLTQLLQEFSKAGEQVKWNLGILKDEQIGKKLKNIRQQLEKLQQGPVTKALNEANDILKKQKK
ncbi:hypothetical protein, conserved [Babesia ovata]|uniref:Extracellular matrix-binding ebh n=1 Tax=Babesia ovata TaxID=189622 RepID=A0A2H6KJC6_9APIC|nr:uncharacterized protein BOVATA_045960 [Babesia ovata]GBE63103.1 hypothetical protein, conserved [Babesia ovata]